MISVAINFCVIDVQFSGYSYVIIQDNETYVNYTLVSADPPGSEFCIFISNLSS